MPRYLYRCPNPYHPQDLPPVELDRPVEERDDEVACPQGGCTAALERVVASRGGFALAGGRWAKDGYR